jgi:hypothetical protein
MKVFPQEGGGGVLHFAATFARTARAAIVAPQKEDAARVAEAARDSLKYTILVMLLPSPIIIYFRFSNVTRSKSYIFTSSSTCASARAFTTLEDT